MVVHAKSKVLTPEFLTRLRNRFPHVDESAVPHMVEDHGRLTQHLAERHDLTPLEAREELMDFLGLEQLTETVQATGT